MEKNKLKILISGKKLIIIFTALLALHYLFFIFYGFEVTETGFHLSKQWGMFHGLWKENFDYFAGTNIIGGLWLLIPDKPLLIWSRLGYIFIQLLTAVYTYKILLLYFKPLRVFTVCSVISISLSFWQYYYTINYDNLPLMLLLISTYLVLRENRTPSKNNTLIFISAGVLISICIFCKITYLPALLLPVTSIYASKNSNIKELNKKKLINYFYGVITGTGLLVLFMVLSGGLSTYIQYFYKAAEEFLNHKNISEQFNLTRDHSFSTLYFIYKGSYLKIVNISILNLLMTFIFGFIYTRVGINKFLKVMFLIISGWFYYYQIFEPSANHGIISFVITLLIIRLITSRPEDLKKFSEPVIAAVIIFMISFFGSDLGISTGFRSGSVVFLLSIAILLVYDAKSTFGKFKQSYRFLFYLSLILFSIFYIRDDYRHYQDLKFEFMTAGFESPQLKGIKSGKHRVEVVDSLLTYLNTIPYLEYKKVFYSKHSPMLYYLTGVKYSLNSPWDTLNDLEEISEDFKLKPPDIFVLPQGSHRDYNWPDCDAEWAAKDGGEKTAQRYYGYYDSFLKENNYIEVYKNSFYTVYNLVKKGIENE